jgi:hypothetical protein
MDFPANQYVPSSGIEWMEAANGDRRWRSVTRYISYLAVPWHQCPLMSTTGHQQGTPAWWYTGLVTAFQFRAYCSLLNLASNPTSRNQRLFRISVPDLGLEGSLRIYRGRLRCHFHPFSPCQLTCMEKLAQTKLTLMFGSQYPCTRS